MSEARSGEGLGPGWVMAPDGIPVRPIPLAGEGLIGLTRAFQYAGARSVVASLWEVSDRSTALLMRRFYAALHAGAAKDEALRQAQLSVLRGPQGQNGFAHPFHWAAFELTGDWR